MKILAALLVFGGIMAGCQRAALSAESSDTQALNFLGVIVSDEMPDANPVDMMLVSIDAKMGAVVYNYHTTHNFAPCDVGRWICVWANQIKIMIPKDWANNEQVWDYRGVDFRVVRRHYDGQEVSEIVVEAKERGREGPPQYYLYSFKRGLVSFRIHFSGAQGVLIPVVMSRLW